MHTQIIAMKSSSGTPHHVEVTLLDDGRVAINCSCMGSQMGTLCKHREAIIGGDDSLVVDEHKQPYFDIFQAIGTTQVPVAYRTYKFHLDEIDAEKKALTARTSDIKKKFAKMLREGL